ncbi:ABC transporter permease [Kitasatospora sp. NPDC008115]|uniref:ABC transporter permease n=1 Tax=Kitasatospora sp. NPDC008115 TaxID=3364022 RepID=UPI0036E5C0B3
MPYWTRKAAGALATLWLASVAVFLLLRLAPGDPVSAALGAEADQEQRDHLGRQLGVDRPLPVQYLTWLGGLLGGDPGLSFHYREPVTRMIGQSLGSTVQLAIAAGLLMLVLGLLLGAALAAERRGRLARALDPLTTAVLALPVYVTAVLFVFVFAVLLRVLPAGGERDLFTAPDLAVQYLALPAVALALPGSVVLARLLATELRRTRQEEFVLTAIAKGAPPRRILLRHVLPNSLAPFCVEFGLNLGELLGGAVVAEQLFARHGLGQLLLDAINQRDYPVAQTLIMLAVAVAVTVQLGSELLVGRLDPRIARAGTGEGR